jgi:hypothetical protein
MGTEWSTGEAVVEKGPLWVLTTLIAWMLMTGPAHGQNLVPNPGFETPRECPSGSTRYGERMTTVADWSSATFATPDYFNRCSRKFESKVPMNIMGKQEPRSGDGYCGILMEKKSGWTEYLTCALITPLQKDSTYIVEFWVSLGSASKWHWTGPVGALLTITPTEFGAEERRMYTCIENEPQVEGSAPVAFSQRWTRVHGEYKASGGEHFITIGFFCAATGSFQKNEGDEQRPVLKKGAYYYIDDVSVVLKDRSP